MNEQTIEKMRTMKLFGMLRAFQTNLETDTAVRYTPDELVGLMVSSEWDDRYNRKLDRSVLRARFRYKASIEQISFTNERELHKNQLLRLADCDFIKKKENLLITGSTGIGKSFIASALGHQACSLGYKVQYEHCTKLFSRLKMGKADGTYLKEIAKIEKQDLLILDDFGMQPLDAQNRAILMDIIEDRHGKHSTLFTAQVPVNKWYEVIGEQTIADAIMDRIIHDAHRLELKGESLRKKRPNLTAGITE
ncbi:IS21-like element helper ATPase IstB [Flavihumibacter stibioxidans]|uniref:ATP-binding protein n=1 Tax=Flavihumibacter stibioxidans TaxID=1834163 RepID=A0ABR7M6R5_9BACT|nr:IS21-like element helper ATPase IstB [Flavihumibacter stibioxidans]MBC6490708.1 ATP-binding protein [Flavihumibacter stibioxidans]